jgi:hypothetical protein
MRFYHRLSLILEAAVSAPPPDTLENDSYGKETVSAKDTDVALLCPPGIKSTQTKCILFIRVLKRQCHLKTLTFLLTGVIERFKHGASLTNVTTVTGIN